MNKTIRQTDRKAVNYEHAVPPSLLAGIIQLIFRLTGSRKKIEKKIFTSRLPQKAASPGKSLIRESHYQTNEVLGRKVWTISSLRSPSDTLVVYLHGGAYMSNITRAHWDLIERLFRKTGATFVVPEYPTAPESDCMTTFSFVESLIDALNEEYPTHKLILAGDSAGAGLALGLAQKLRNKERKTAHQIILLSPWLDVTMSNPDLRLYETNDRLLTIDGLRHAGQIYAGTLDPTDFRISPLYGRLTGLGEISVFTGTNDLLHADALSLKDHPEIASIDFNYFCYPGMFHDWIIVTALPEALDAIEKVSHLITDQKL